MTRHYLLIRTATTALARTLLIVFLGAVVVVEDVALLENGGLSGGVGWHGRWCGGEYWLVLPAFLEGHL